MKQPTEGQRSNTIVIDWTFLLGNQERISDPKHISLLSEFQSILRVMLEERFGGVRMQPGSLWGTFAGITETARFMWAHGVTSVSHLTSQKSWEFVDYFLRSYEQNGEGGGRSRKVTHASAYKILHPLTQIHGLHIVLRNNGLATLPEAPYSGMSTYAVVKKYLKLDKSAPHKPIPDKVTAPTLSRAATWVLVGAQDVIELQRFAIDLIQGVEDKVKRKTALRTLRSEIAAFRFRNDPRTGKPWQSKILVRERRMLDGRQTGLTVIQSFRRLIQDMVSACIICIQGGTGMRAHELIGLRARHRDDGTLVCVERTLSADGLMEIFALSGVTAKRNEDQHCWTAGLRPVGTDTIPLPIQAAQVLDELLRPWRKLSGDDHLLLTFSSPRALPREAGSIGKFCSDTMTRAQREFAADALMECGMSWRSANRLCFEVRGQRWRTTFAHAIFRTSPKLIGSLRDHFHHMSELITDQGYIGNDASLLEDLESERIQSTAKTLLQISMGKKVGAGGIQRLISKYKEQLALDISQMPGSNDLERAEALVVLSEVRIWTGPYASCLINVMPSASRCNPRAELSPGFAKPDYANRSPSSCAACNCCIIMPEHTDFWKERYERNVLIVEKERASAAGSDMRSIAVKRVSQSRAILRSLGMLGPITDDVVAGSDA